MEAKVRIFKNVVLLRVFNISRGKEKMTELEIMKEIAHLCIILGKSKALKRNGWIDPMFLRPL